MRYHNLILKGNRVMAVRDIGKGILNTGASLLVGAVPGFLGTAFLAATYALSAGIATAIGLGGGLSVVAGLVGTAMFGGAGLSLGFLAVGVGLTSLAFIPGIRNAQIKAPAVILGAALGVAGSIGMAHHLTSEVQPPQRTGLTETFSKANTAMVAPAVFTIAPANSTAPTPAMPG
jgi:hypothetical protein